MKKLNALNLDLAMLDKITSNAMTITQGNNRMQNAIMRGRRLLTDNPFWSFDGHTLTVLSETSYEIYNANGVCECLAYKYGQICKHRTASRLLLRYTELTA